MKYKLIFWDLDGTLIDSMDDIFIVVNEILFKYGFEPLERPRFKELFAPGSISLFKTVSGRDGDFIKKMFSDFLEIINSHSWDKTYLYPNVKEVLSSLSAINIINTNKPEGITHTILKQLGIDGFFERVVDFNTFGVRKPDPLPVLEISKEVGVDLKDVLVIGDSDYDVNCAKNAGVDSCGVLYGFGSPADLEGADYLIENISEIQNIVCD